MTNTSKIQTSILCIIILIFISPLLTIMLKGLFPKIFEITIVKKITDPQMAGVTFEERNSDFTPGAWLNRDFQNKFEKWFDYNNGARRIFIKINNQINYSLFNKTYIPSIVIGKENVLYEKNYIDEYYNTTSPRPKEEIEQLAKKIAKVQTLLKQRGIQFIVLITPSKAYTYPQYIPDYFASPPKLIHDYETGISLFDKLGINYVDGQRITLEKQNGVKYPLFCKGGTHWNYLGAYFTVEQVIKKIEVLSNRQIPNIVLQNVEIDNNPTGSDRDLASLLNTLFVPDKYVTPHPVMKPETHSSDNRGNGVVVGGSFNWIPIEILFNNQVFKSIDFYYYYSSLFTYPKNELREKSFNLNKIDWDTDMLKKDTIILEINESTFGSEHVRNFLDDALKHI